MSGSGHPFQALQKPTFLGERCPNWETNAHAWRQDAAGSDFARKSFRVRLVVLRGPLLTLHRTSVVLLWACGRLNCQGVRLQWPLLIDSRPFHGGTSGRTRNILGDPAKHQATFYTTLF